MSDEPSPRPWRVNTPMTSAPWKEGNPHIYDAKGVGVAIVGIGKSPDVNSVNARLIVAAVNGRDRLRDLVRRLADLSESLLANYEYRYCEDVNSMAFVENTRGFLREARAVIEEGRSLSAKPFGRPATEQEVDSRFPGIEWCMHCTTACPLSHHDALCVCDHYNAPDKKGGAAPSPTSSAPKAKGAE